MMMARTTQNTKKKDSTVKSVGRRRMIISRMQRNEDSEYNFSLKEIIGLMDDDDDDEETKEEIVQEEEEIEQPVDDNPVKDSSQLSIHDLRRDLDKFPLRVDELDDFEFDMDIFENM